MCFYTVHGENENMIVKKNYELHFSGHETFPLRQMWLKKVCEQAAIDGFIKKSIFTDTDSITRFGVGKNMVSSIRHWALATGVLEESGEKIYYKLTDLGQRIFSDNGWDPYSEYAATAWLIHWQLAGRRIFTSFSKHRSSTWYLLFNTYISSDFNHQDIINHIKKYISDNGKKNTAEMTIKRDVETCIKGYSPNSVTKSIEDITEPMLAELNLIKQTENGRLCFRRGAKSSLPDGVFDYALIMYWLAVGGNENSLSLDEISFGDGSPGRVFKLDEESVAERLFSLEERTGGIFTWTSSSGISQIIRKKSLNSNQLIDFSLKRLKAAYL